MQEKNITTTINLIKKCKDQLIILQMLVSHLQYLLLNTQESQVHKYSSDIEQLLFYSCVRTKKQSKLEKMMLQYLTENRKKLSDFKKRLILIFLLNQDAEKTNFFILNELLHNHLFNNQLDDFLIIKYISKVTSSKFYGIYVKNRLHEDVFKSFLLEVRNKEVNNALWSSLLPIYINTNIEPPRCGYLTQNFFLHRIYESLYMYSTFEKDKNKVATLFVNNMDIMTLFGLYLKHENPLCCSLAVKTEILYVFIQSHSLFEDIKYSIEQTVDKEGFIDNLQHLCNQLKRKYKNE